MNVKWVNDLKLRVGAGVTGNSAVDAYKTQGAVTSLFIHSIQQVLQLQSQA